MFEKYNINDLFIASIDVIYPDSYDIIVGCHLLISHDYNEGYRYKTILVKISKGYIDLNNSKRKITDTRIINETSYLICDMEPLSKYYNQDGTRKRLLSRREAIKVLNRKN